MAAMGGVFWINSDIVCLEVSLSILPFVTSSLILGLGPTVRYIVVFPFPICTILGLRVGSLRFIIKIETTKEHPPEALISLGGGLFHHRMDTHQLFSSLAERRPCLYLSPLDLNRAFITFHALGKLHRNHLSSSLMANYRPYRKYEGSLHFFVTPLLLLNNVSVLISKFYAIVYLALVGQSMSRCYHSLYLGSSLHPVHE